MATGGPLRDLKQLRDRILLRKAVCPFVSSTFQDFSVERDYLVKKVFPLLDALCQQRGTYFAYVDLRWGITSEQQDRGELVRLCLDYVRENLPFFVGLLGDRYGSHRDPSSSERLTSRTVLDPARHTSWLDRAYLTAANDYDWLLEDDHQYASITEVEITQAVFVDHAEHALFYFRRAASSESAAATNGELAESEYARQRLASLKHKLVNAGCNVKHFGSPQELCTQLLGDFKRIIDGLYPPIGDFIAPLSASGDAMDATNAWREWAMQELYAKTRRRVFVPTPEIRRLFNLLDQFIRSVRSNVAPPRALTLTRQSAAPLGVQRHSSVPHGLQLPQPQSTSTVNESHSSSSGSGSGAGSAKPSVSENTSLSTAFRHKQLSSTSRTLVELFKPNTSANANANASATLGDGTNGEGRRSPRASRKAFSQQTREVNAPPPMLTHCHGMTSLPTGVTLDDASNNSRYVEADIAAVVAAAAATSKTAVSTSALSNSTSLSASLNCAASPSNVALQPMSIGAASSPAASLFDASVLVLSGERGVGKTSILVNWLAQFASEDDAFPLLLAHSATSQPPSPAPNFSPGPNLTAGNTNVALNSASSYASLASSEASGTPNPSPNPNSNSHRASLTGLAASSSVNAVPTRPHGHRVAANKQLTRCISRTLTRVFSITTNDSVRIFTQYVGSTARSKSIGDFLRRIVAELRRDHESTSPADMAATIAENDTNSEQPADSGRGTSSRSRPGEVDLSSRVAELESAGALERATTRDDPAAAATDDLLQLQRVSERCFDAIRTCRQRCVLVIDALDELSDGDAKAPFGGTAYARAKELSWLPARLPANCKLIVTTTRSDATLKILRNRDDTRIVTLEPLFDETTKRCIIQNHLRSHYKVLTDAQLARICEAKMSSLPLFLALLTTELRQFGSPDGAVTPHLDTYLEATSIRELWRKIVERWNSDYDLAMRPRNRSLASQSASAVGPQPQLAHGSPVKQGQTQQTQIALHPDAVSPDDQDEPVSPDDYPMYTMRYAREHAYVLDAYAKVKFKPVRGWVCDALRLIAVSRYGLTDRDLLMLLREQLGYSWVTQFDWLLLRNVANEFLYESAHGLLRFCHEHLQEAIEYDLLGYVRAPPTSASASASACPSRTSPVHGSAGFAGSPTCSRLNAATPSSPNHSSVFGPAPVPGSAISTLFKQFHSHMADFLWRFERDAIALHPNPDASARRSSTGRESQEAGSGCGCGSASGSGAASATDRESGSSSGSRAQQSRRRTSELLYHLYRAERYSDLYDVLTEPNTIVYLVAMLTRDNAVSLSAAHHRSEHLALPYETIGGASSLAEDAAMLKRDITLYWCTLLAQNFPINRAYYDLTIHLCRQCRSCRSALGLAVEQALQACAIADSTANVHAQASSRLSTSSFTTDAEAPHGLSPVALGRPDNRERDATGNQESVVDMLSVEEVTASATCNMARLDVPSSRSMWNFVKSVSDAEIELAKTNGDLNALPGDTDDSRVFLQLIANTERRTRAGSFKTPSTEFPADGSQLAASPRSPVAIALKENLTCCTHTVGMYELWCIQVGILLGGLGHFLSEIGRFLSSQSLLLVAYNIFCEQLACRDAEREEDLKQRKSESEVLLPRIELNQNLNSEAAARSVSSSTSASAIEMDREREHVSVSSASSRSSGEPSETFNDETRRERGSIRRQKISVQMNHRSRSSMLEHQTVKWYLCGVEECLGNMHQQQLALTAAERWFRQALRTNYEYIDYLQFEKKYLDSTVEFDSDSYELTGESAAPYSSVTDADNVFQKAYETRLRLLNKLASLCVYEKRFAEAEQMLRDAIDVAHRCTFSGEKATIVFNVGVLRRKQGLLEEAEKHLRKALHMREAWFGKNDLSVSEVLLQLAAVITGRLRDRADSVSPVSAKPRALLHTNIGSNLPEHHSHDSFLAESYLRRALAIRLEARGPEHLQVATAQFHLAMLLAAQPSPMLKEESRELLRSGIDTRTKLLGADHKQTLHMRGRLCALETELRQPSSGSSIARDRSRTFLSPARPKNPRPHEIASPSTPMAVPVSPVALMSRRATPTYAHSTRSARNSLSRPDDLPIVSVTTSQRGAFNTRTHVVSSPKQLLVNGIVKPREGRAVDRGLKTRKLSQTVASTGLSPSHAASTRRSASARRLVHVVSQHASSEEDLLVVQMSKTAIGGDSGKMATRHADSSPDEAKKASLTPEGDRSRRRGVLGKLGANRKWGSSQSELHGDIVGHEALAANPSGPERRTSWLRKRRDEQIVSTDVQHGQATIATQHLEC